MAKIKDLLPTPPINYSVSPDELVQGAVQLMGAKNVGIVMIMEEGKLVGVFSERDLIRRVLAAGKDPATVKIKEVMTTTVLTADADEDPEQCIQKMDARGCRHLPVISGGKPIAMISVRDLMRYVLRRKVDDLKMLEDYVTSP